MGTKMAPVYTNIYMEVLEEVFLSKCTLQPSMYLRYINDIFMIWPHSENDLAAFHEAFNKHNPNIQFTMECSKEKIHFLDVNISRNDNTLSASVQPTT